MKINSSAAEWDTDSDSDSESSVVTPPNLPPVVTNDEKDYDPNQIPKPDADGDGFILAETLADSILQVQQLRAELERATAKPVFTTSTLHAKRVDLATLKNQLKRAEANCAAMQQGNPHVPFPGADHHSAIKKNFEARPHRLAEQLETLVTFKASGARPVFPKQREVSEPLALMPFERLFTEGVFRTGVTEWLAHWLDYRIEYLKAEVSGLLNPVEALDNLRLELANAESMDEVTRLKAAIAAASAASNGIKNEDDVTRVKSLLRAQYKPVNAAFLGLLSQAKDLLSEYMAEAVLEETKFFARFGFPHEATSLSSVVSAAIEKIDETIRHKNAITSDPWGARALPQISHNPIEETFGLKFEF